MTKKDAADYLSACADGYDPIFDEAVGMAVAALQSQVDNCSGSPAPKVMTNADHIRSMNEEDLAEFLAYAWATPVRAWKQDSGEVLSWLQEPCNDN